MKVSNSLGLQFAFSTNGALQSIELAPIRISMATPPVSSRSVANVFLRLRGSAALHVPLLGGRSPSQFRATEGSFEARGSWQGLDYLCSLELAPAAAAWQWRVRVENTGDHPRELDLVHVQDVGLKTRSDDPVNEYYVSQYLERCVLDDPQHGRVVACRQNMKESGGHPWLLLSCAQRAVAASTDGLQFYGRTFRATGEPAGLSADELAGELAGESSVVALQQAPFVLEPGEVHVTAFQASYSSDHPAASSAADLALLPELLASFARETGPLPGEATAAASDRLALAPTLPVDDLSQDELVTFFGSGWRHAEQAAGQLLSFFVEGPRHVVLRAKELSVDRPHGHIMQANAGSLPDESIMSTTAFACGVFNSHLTQGNTNFSTLLSVCTNPATPNLEGQRIFVRLADGEFVLGVPSAFEMGLNHCRWIYKRAETCIEVSTWTSPRAPFVHLHVQVLAGGPVGLLLSHQFDGLNRWHVAPAQAREYVATPSSDGMLASKFPAARFRLVVDETVAGLSAYALTPAQAEGEPAANATFVLEVPSASTFSMAFVGEATALHALPALAQPEARRRADCAQAANAWTELSRGIALQGPRACSAIGEILPWYGANALIHFLTPYGLEQFSGAAWGTRDVCQGPIDLLLCNEHLDQAKQVLRIVFSRQDVEGGWPQWWMFDSFADVRADGAHGDVVYWCILALCSYVRSSGDFAFLQEPLPFYCPPGAQPVAAAPVREHIQRIIALVVSSFVPGTALVQFGGGDWNDSLQPVSKELARRLISSWTVQMCYQALREYSELCARAGDDAQATELAALYERVFADFHRHLVKDGVVAGYGLVQDDQTIDVLLHPTDSKTGVHYSLLPMNRGVISGVFSKQQAEDHLTLIERHLKGPDGARLMDRPLRYHGGLQTIFQRAESSTYFGREIGLMYVHEHLRYAESLARMGKPEPLLHALLQAIPVAYRDVVPQGALRQSNCYYSSSDVLFGSRYEADQRYPAVVAGELALYGGWRVYSSGPGIYVALIVTRLLGLRVAFDQLIIDPVLAPTLAGLTVSLCFRGHALTLTFRLTGPGFGPRSISVNDEPVTFTREPNPYREGGAVLGLASFLGMLSAHDNRVEVEI